MSGNKSTAGARLGAAGLLCAVLGSLAAPMPSAEALQQKTLDVLRTGPATLTRTLPYSHSAPRPDDVRFQTARS